LEKEEAVNVTDADALPAVADPIVGAVEGPLVPALCEPRIGMLLFYPSLLHLIVGLAEHFPPYH
jgi:hypothetical protein